MFKYAQRICVFTVAVTGLYAQTTTSTPTSETRTSGTIGIAEGQTARFNVLNSGLPVATSAPACAAVLTYYDAKGTMLKTSTVSVAPGVAGYLDLFSDADLALAADQRMQIRATFTVALTPAAATATRDDDKPKPMCRLVGTLEIFNSLTGVTSVVTGGTHPVGAPAETAAAN